MTKEKTSGSGKATLVVKHLKVWERKDKRNDKRKD
jgi:hypothetical protein